MDSFNVIISFFLFQLAECSPEIAALTVLLSDSMVKPEHEHVIIAILVNNFEYLIFE